MKFDYRQKLVDVLRSRQERNPYYSMRSYARDLDVNVTTLSEVMAGKRKLSEKNGKKIVEGLSLSPSEAELLSDLIRKKVFSNKTNVQYDLVVEDEFRMISDWYCMALLKKSAQQNVVYDEKELAAEFGIKTDEVAEAVATLQRLGFVEISNKGFLTRTRQRFETSEGVPSYAVRKYHKANYELGAHALDHVPMEDREISSININLRPEMLPKLKEVINQFEDELIDKYDHEEGSKVYTINFSVFPASLAKGDLDDSQS